MFGVGGNVEAGRREILVVGKAWGFLGRGAPRTRSQLEKKRLVDPERRGRVLVSQLKGVDGFLVLSFLLSLARLRKCLNAESRAGGSRGCTLQQNPGDGQGPGPSTVHGLRKATVRAMEAGGVECSLKRSVGRTFGFDTVSTT
jgi:hypothetical protein